MDITWWQRARVAAPSQTLTADVATGSAPAAYTITGGIICTANTGVVTLSNSDLGVNYQLKLGSNSNTQAAKAGTGSALTWTGLAANAGYHIVASAPGGCTSTTLNAAVTSGGLPMVFTLTGGSICTPNTGTLTLSNSQTGVTYQLKDNTNSDVQSAQTGTASSLTWTGLSAANGYYVVATNANGCTSQTAAANITTATPPTVFTLTGSAICTPNTGTMNLNGSQIDISYQLKNSSNANIQGAKAGTGAALNWTTLAIGNGYYVVATASGGCTSQTLAADVASGGGPTVYTITGGIICTPNTGVVTLSNSDLGVSYQLKLGSNSNAQAAQAGTGSALTWTGLAADNGYHIVATASGGCTSTTLNTAVTSGGAPTVFTLTGSAICTPNTGTLTLSSSQTGVSYQLKDNTNNNVQSAKPGTSAALTWTALGTATGYYVVATNTNGCTSQTVPADITTASGPTVFTLTGSAVCTANMGTMNLSGSVTGVTYQLKNSSNANVQGAKAGTGSALNWTTLAIGNGYYVVATAAGGCTSQTLAADVATGTGPTVFTITPGPSCGPNTGTITLSNSTAGVSYQLKFGSNSNAQAAKAGTGAALIWTGLQANNGYHVVATASGGCTSTTPNVAVVNGSTPVVANLTGSNVCVDNTGTIQLSNSRTGVSYQLKDNTNANVQAPKTVASNNAALTWTGLAIGTGYYVVETGSAGCTSQTATADVTNTGCNTRITLNTPTNNPKLGALSTTMGIKVWPLPTESFFNLTIQSASRESVVINIYDITGRQIQQLRGSSLETYRFGDMYVAGTYLIEVIQGTNRVTQKILKQ